MWAPKESRQSDPALGIVRHGSHDLSTLSAQRAAEPCFPELNYSQSPFALQANSFQRSHLLVGRTPSSARVPLDSLYAVTGHDIRRRHSQIRVVDQSRSFPSC